MKRTTFLLGCFIGLACVPAFGADQPRGDLLEIHSCEVYAGPCVVNSEITQAGRYMFRAWNFTGGTFDSVPLQGLTLAALQLSDDNLAEKDSKSGQAVVYLPETATQSQRNTLLDWLKASQPDFHPSELKTRTTQLKFTKSGNGYSITAGDSISVRTAPLAQCQLGGCGEVLWYKPRSTTSIFTVAAERELKVNEPLLQLKWMDGGRRTAFLARFGEKEINKPVFVSLAELCGGSPALF